MEPDEDAELLDQLNQVLAQKKGQQSQVNPEKKAVMDYSHLIKPCVVKVQKLSLKDIEQLQSKLRREKPGKSSQQKPANADRPNSNSLLHREKQVKQENTDRHGSRVGARLLAQGSQQRSESVPGNRSSRSSSLVCAESIRLLMKEPDRSRSGSPASLHSKKTRKMASEHERSDSRASSRSSSKSDRLTRRDNERPDSRASSRSSSMNHREEPEERKSRSKVKAEAPIRLNKTMKSGSTSNARATMSRPSSSATPKIKIEPADEKSGSPFNRRRDNEKYAHLKLMLPVIKLEKVDLPTEKTSVGTTLRNQKIGPTSRTVEAKSQQGPSTSKKVKIGPKSKMSQVADDSSDSESPIIVEDCVDSDDESIISLPSKSKVTVTVEESDSDSKVMHASSVAKSSMTKSKIGPKSKMAPHARKSIKDSDVAMEQSDKESVNAQASNVTKSTSIKPKIGPKSKMAPHTCQSVEDSDVDMEKSDNESVTAQASNVAKSTSIKPKIGPKSKMAPHTCQSVEDSDVDMEKSDDERAQASSVAKSTSRKLNKIGPKSRMARPEDQQPRQSIKESDSDVELSDDISVTAQASSVSKSVSKPKIGPKSKMARHEIQLSHRLTEKPVKEKHGDDSVTVQTSNVAVSMKLPKIGPKSKIAPQVAHKPSEEPEVVDTSVNRVISSSAKSTQIAPKSGESGQQATSVRKVGSNATKSKQRKEVDSDNESIICLDSEAPMKADLQTTLKRVRDEFVADDEPSRKRLKNNETPMAVSLNVQQAEAIKFAADGGLITKRCTIALDRNEIRRYLQQQLRCGQKGTENYAASRILLNLLYPAPVAEMVTIAVQTNPFAKLTARKVSDIPESPKPKLSCVNLSFLKEPSPVNSQSSTVVPSQLNPDNPESILCLFCSKRFLNSSVLKCHLMVQHPDAVMVTRKKHYCHKCKIIFLGRVAFEKHQSTCSKLLIPPSSQFQQARPHISQSPPEMLQPSPPFNAQVPILCDVCGLNLPDSLSLTRHKMDNHSFECGKCMMKFSSRAILLNHRAEMHGQQQAQVPILCEICGLSFVDKLSMARHKNETHNFGCDKCAMNFNSLDSFQNHRVEKHGYHRCTLCRLDFPDLEQLLQHVANTEHPYSLLTCEKCRIKFTKPEFLIRHNAVRHNQGYFCMKCLEVFGDITKMLVHYEKCKRKINNVLEFADGNEVLNKQRRHTCDRCSLKFATEANLHIHKESFHKDQLNCPHCKKFFTSWGQHNTELCKKNLLQVETAQSRNFEGVFLDTLTQEKSTETVNSPRQYRKKSQQQSSPQTNQQLQQGNSPQIYSDPSEFLGIPTAVPKPVTQIIIKATKKAYQLQRTPIPGTYIQQQKTKNQRPITPRATYKCHHCNLEFQTSSSLIVHNMSHRIMDDVASSNFHCEYCNEDYDNIVNLSLHRKACWKNPKWNEYDGTGETTQEFAEVKLENYLSDEETTSCVDFEKSSTDSVETVEVESPSQIHIIHTYFKCVHCLRLFDNSGKLQEHLNLPPEESVDKHMVMITNDILKKLLENFKGKPLRLQMHQNSQNPPQTIECGNCNFSTTFQCEMINHCKTCKPIEVLDLDEEPMEMETEDNDPLFSNQADSSGPTIVECHTEIIEEDTSLPNLSSEPLVVISEESQSVPFIPEQSDVQFVSVGSESNTEVQPSINVLPSDCTEKLNSSVNAPSDNLTSENSKQHQDKESSEIVKETEPASDKLASKSSEKLEVENKQDSGNDKVMTEIEPPSDNLVSESSEQIRVQEKQSSEPMVTSDSTVESSEEHANQNTESITNSVLTNGIVSTEVQEPSDSATELICEDAQDQSTESNPDIVISATEELHATNKVTEEVIVQNGTLDATVLETELEPNCASPKESSTQGDSGKFDTASETEHESNTTFAKESNIPEDSDTIDTVSETEHESNTTFAKESNIPEDSDTLDTVSETEPAKEGETQKDSGTLEIEHESAKESNTQDSGSLDDAVFEKIAEECTNSILQIQEKSMSSNSYGDEQPEGTPMDIDESAVFSHEDCTDSIPRTSFNFQSPIAVTPSCTGNPNTQPKHWDFAAPLANH